MRLRLTFMIVVVSFLYLLLIVLAQDETPPIITWELPTPDNDASTNNDWVHLNTTITDASNTSAFFDWNYSLVGYWAMDWYNSTGIFDNSTHNNFGNYPSDGSVTNETFNCTSLDIWLNLNHPDIINNSEIVTNTTNNFSKDADYEMNYSSGRIKCLSTGNMSKNQLYNISYNYNRTPSLTDGKYGKALSFDGIDDYLMTGNNLTITNSRITMEAWIYLKNITDIKQIAEFHTGENEVFLETVTDTSKIQWTVNFPDGPRANSSSISLNEWHHVVGTYDGENMKIYIDGNLSDSVSWNGVFHVNSPLSIGRDNEASIQYWDGLIDEVRVYNRALSPEEINASYNNGLYRLYHNFTSLSDGSYDYYAYAIDTSGNANKTGVRTVTVVTPDSEIKGIALDMTTGLPVAGSTVRLTIKETCKSFSTTTDSNGEYDLNFPSTYLTSGKNTLLILANTTDDRKGWLRNTIFGDYPHSSESCPQTNTIEVRGKIFVDSLPLFNAYVKVTVEETGDYGNDTTDSNGIYDVTFSSEMQPGEVYNLIITTTSDSKKGWMKIRYPCC